MSDKNGQFTPANCGQVPWFFHPVTVLLNCLVQGYEGMGNAGTMVHSLYAVRTKA